MRTLAKLWALVLMVGVAAGCGVDPESEAAVDSSAGAVHGVISYGGALHGPLVVAVFASFPPRGAPIAQQRIEAPHFPQAYEIRGVPPGAWYVLAIVDTDEGDGARFHPSRDPGGAFGVGSAPWSLRLEPAQGARGIDIILADPSATSPWMRTSYR